MIPRSPRRHASERAGELYARRFPHFSYLPTTNTSCACGIPAARPSGCLTWILVDKAMPPEAREAQRLQTIRTFSPSGLLEQDDGENWGEIRTYCGARCRSATTSTTRWASATRTTSIPVSGEHRYVMSEGAVRGFYRRYVQLMTTDSFPIDTPVQAAGGADPALSVTSRPSCSVTGHSWPVTRARTPRGGSAHGGLDGFLEAGRRHAVDLSLLGLGELPRTSPAALASSCSTLLTPTITDVTTSFATSQAITRLLTDRVDRRSRRTPRERGHDRQVLIAAHLADDRAAGSATGPGGRRLALAVLAGQDATGERVVRDQADVVGTARRDELLLALAVQQAVVVLNGGEWQQAETLGLVHDSTRRQDV